MKHHQFQGTRRARVLSVSLLAAATALAGSSATAAGRTTLDASTYQLANFPGWASQQHGSLITMAEVRDPANQGADANGLLVDLAQKGGVTTAVRAWRITYVTSGADPGLSGAKAGAPLVATGILLVPVGKAWPTTDRAADPYSAYNSNRPIVVFAPKTQGVGSECAPSKALEFGKEELSEVKRMAQSLNRGYAVAVTDYDGYADQVAAHQYLVGQTIGHAVLDMALVVRSVLPGINAYDDPSRPTKLTGSSPMAIWGYSEGGLAAAWAGQMLPTYAPTLQGVVRSVATGGTVADIRRATIMMDGTPGSGMELSGVWGYHVAYPKSYANGGPYFDINDTFKRDLLGNEYISQWGQAAPVSSTAGAILHPATCVDTLGSQVFKSMVYRNNGLHGTYRGKYFDTNAFTISQLTDTVELGWNAILNANNPGSMKINLPTYFYHGSTAVTVKTTTGSYGDAKEGDVLLGADAFNNYFSAMCANQTPVWRQVVLSTYLSLTNHESASDKAFDSVLAWTTSHLKGETPVYDPKKDAYGTPTVMRCSDRR